jgi:ubiquinone/menaquinone biosynthesis C-methylase UbiE
MEQLRDFDAAALSWDEEPRRVKLAAGIATAMAACLPLDPAWEALDYGCGTGLLTLQLAPRLRRIVGVDSSRGMLDRLEGKLRDGAVTNVRTVQVENERVNLPDGELHLIVSAMTLHHVPETGPLLRELHRLLRPGGWIALADLEAEDGSFHEDRTGVFHHGFTRGKMEEMLTATGFVDVTMTIAATVDKGERSYPVLLAVARAGKKGV